MTLLEVLPTFRYLVFWTAVMNSSKELGSFRFCKSSHMIWKKDILKNDFRCRLFHNLTVHFTSDTERLCRSQWGLSETCHRCRTHWLRPRSGGEEPSVKPRAEGVKPSAVTLPPWSCRGYLASWNLLGKVEMTVHMSSDPVCRLPQQWVPWHTDFIWVLFCRVLPLELGVQSYSQLL